ncbi:Leucine carboxyl methyltransferase [Metarhizium album ARSEF 1941]|uniref:Leucine carboxyl methyltransferase n=1 Tax=Metarhizium album (strain ARSEF 1941) TaxID=1081103 RepID=A0A0B2WK66_METAS|nr:Leucine carboxyl methyltransferase [Metarhizium album ARSEF 1941]KHN94298.1 Leucine carboxyl methyltransferase [Metarhizium album ARSEF 1941]
MAGSTQESDRRGQIKLTSTQETLLITLYSRWQDFYSPRPLLGDRWSAEAMERVLEQTTEARSRTRGGMVSGLPLLVLRARLFDEWTAEFLAENERATVVHLACGLDTRALRLRDRCGPGVTWIDVDFPDVIELRRRMEIPEPRRAADGYSYDMVASSVVDAGWLDSLPAGKPTLVIFEGLTMYLSPDEGRGLIRRLLGRFGTGQLVFDSVSTASRFVLNTVPGVKGLWTFKFDWAIDDPGALCASCPGLVLATSLRLWDMPGLERLPWPMRLAAFVASWIPILRDVSRMNRFNF